MRDVREVIPDALGQTLADEEGQRMPIEKQQIEIARVPQAPDTVKEIPDAYWRHEGGHDYSRPPEEGKEVRAPLTTLLAARR